MRCWRLGVVSILGSCCHEGPVVAPTPRTVDWCANVDAALGNLREASDSRHRNGQPNPFEQLICEPLPGYYTIGKMEGAAASDLRFDTLLPPDLKLDPRPTPAGIVIRDFESSATLDASLGLDLGQVSSWARRWLPNIKVSGKKSEAITVSVKFVDPKFLEINNLLPTVVQATKASTKGTIQCDSLTQIRNRMCQTGTMTAWKALIVKPTIDIHTNDGSELDLAVTSTRFLGAQLTKKESQKDHVTLETTEPLAIAIAWTSYSTDVLCTGAVPECKEPPQPPPPSPQPCDPTPAVSNGNGRDHIRIDVQRNAHPALISGGQYELVFESGDPGQDRDLIDASTGIAIKDFNSTPNSRIGVTSRHATHVYRAQYHSIFGTFMMNNGTDSWNADVCPGDRVVFHWGP